MNGMIRVDIAKVGLNSFFKNAQKLFASDKG